jgi:GTPase obg
VLNKLDMLDEEEAQTRTEAFLEAIGWDYPKPDDRFQFDMETPRLFQISALTHQGTQELVHQINQYLTEKKRIEAEKAEAEQAAANVEIAEQQPKTDTGVFKPE